jgi:hypothetical protein
MDLLMLILVVALVGFLVWVITTYIPMPPIFKTAIMIIVVVALILFLIKRFGGGLPNVL